MIYPPGQERQTSNCNEKKGRHGDAHAPSDRMNFLKSVSRELNPNQVIRKIEHSAMTQLAAIHKTFERMKAAAPNEATTAAAINTIKDSRKYGFKAAP